MNSNSTIVFPSTHVVFEGLKEPKKDIDENEKTDTFLAYSSSKVENENQIGKSGKKHEFLDWVLSMVFQQHYENKYNAKFIF